MGLAVLSDSHPRPFPRHIEQGFRFERVGFCYPGTDRWVLRDLTFELRAGEKLALVGENGAGKTTLVKLLARLYDPTEGRILLDARAEYQVFQRFTDLTASKTAVLISHRFSTVRMADRILVLEDGRLVEDGTHEELLLRKGRHAELFGLQAAGYRQLSAQTELARRPVGRVVSFLGIGCSDDSVLGAGTGRIIEMSYDHDYVTRECR